MIRGNEDPRHPDRPTHLTLIMTAVSVAVSVVPEGLPMVVTICLSSGTAEMVKKNVLVRKLASVETLGAASVICTDKTGTLTEGKMTAVKLWDDFRKFSLTGKGVNALSSLRTVAVKANRRPAMCKFARLRWLRCCAVTRNSSKWKATTARLHVDFLLATLPRLLW
ncbi:putative calcium-transporting ATPase 1 [Phytophthora infestans]|uniref:P-type sodium-transporting ATPase4 n=1 Tax=Phytophthora infestans TaxID=4787 RepID=A0A833SE69_PHYIN|nr:putative calcium-transporting ATPase 1 [Phytophthora infestans]